MEGISLVEAMRDPSVTIRDTMYFAYCESQRALKNRQFKLLEYVIDGRNNMTQLFDLDNDPWETSNLAFDPDHAERLNHLRKEMSQLRDAWGDKETTWGKSFWEGIEWG